MAELKINVADLAIAALPIPIGWVGENEVSAITFDVSSWVKTYGEGTCTLAVQRRTDAYPYIVTMTIEDGLTTWTISDTDTAVVGRGKIQLSYYVGDKKKKSAIYHINVLRSLTGEGTTPDAYDDWLETLQTLTANAEQAAEDAAGSANDAATSETNAANSASSALEYRNSARTYAGNAGASASNAALSAEQAEHYADLAEQGAETAGYAVFDVNDADGNMYVTVSDNLDDDVTFAVNETTGSLEVTING